MPPLPVDVEALRERAEAGAPVPDAGGTRTRTMDEESRPPRTPAVEGDWDPLEVEAVLSDPTELGSDLTGGHHLGYRIQNANPGSNRIEPVRPEMPPVSADVRSPSTTPEAPRTYDWPAIARPEHRWLARNQVPVAAVALDDRERQGLG